MQAMAIDLGHVDQLPLGLGRCFKIGPHEVAIFRSRNGALFAIENSCPHKGGALADGITGDGKVVCPLHGHKFDLKTGQGNEGHECVKTYKIWQDNSNIVISID